MTLADHLPSDRVCPVCWTGFASQTNHQGNAARGKPRIFCSVTCRDRAQKRRQRRKPETRIEQGTL